VGVPQCIGLPWSRQRYISLIPRWCGLLLGTAKTALFVYFSYAQILHHGTRAVMPLKAPVTTLSLIAALFGLFYTAVIVSQLVGMAQTKRKEAQGEK
jgi:hypothetical protein